MNDEGHTKDEVASLGPYTNSDFNFKQGWDLNLYFVVIAWVAWCIHIILNVKKVADL